MFIGQLNDSNTASPNKHLTTVKKLRLDPLYTNQLPREEITKCHCVHNPLQLSYLLMNSVETSKEISHLDLLGQRHNPIFIESTRKIGIDFVPRIVNLTMFIHLLTISPGLVGNSSFHIVFYILERKLSQYCISILSLHNGTSQRNYKKTKYKVELASRTPFNVQLQQKLTLCRYGPPKPSTNSDNYFSEKHVRYFLSKLSSQTRKETRTRQM
jgi:hypothetical protein